MYDAQCTVTEGNYAWAETHKRTLDAFEVWTEKQAATAATATEAVVDAAAESIRNPKKRH